MSLYQRDHNTKTRYIYNWLPRMKKTRFGICGGMNSVGKKLPTSMCASISGNLKKRILLSLMSFQKKFLSMFLMQNVGSKYTVRYCST